MIQLLTRCSSEMPWKSLCVILLWSTGVPSGGEAGCVADDPAADPAALESGLAADWGAVYGTTVIGRSTIKAFVRRRAVLAADSVSNCTTADNAPLLSGRSLHRKPEISKEINWWRRNLTYSCIISISCHKKRRNQILSSRLQLGKYL